MSGQRTILQLLVLAAVLLASGCSFLTFGMLGGDEGRPIRDRGPSIGRVVERLPELQLPAVAAIKPTRDDVMAAYNRVYGAMADPLENHAVGKRLADLHMDRGQDLDVEGAHNPYAAAVTLYEKLLLDADTQDDEAAQVDEILYQLARASDLAGDGTRALRYLDRLIGEFPESAFVGEAHFRRAEMRFSAEDYKSAAGDYLEVVALADATPYYRNAAYMLGWSEFKRSRFDEGLEQFFDVIDDLLRGDGKPVEPAALAGSEQELLADTFRVVTLALAYLDGAKTLADEMRKRERPHWQYLAYQKLADDYFEKERYLDNVATWQTFVEHNSLDLRAPAAHKGMIETLMNAGFPSDVIPKKQEFVLRYGIYSPFWAHHDADARAGYIDTLHGYLSELAKLAHADAQRYDVDTADADARKKSGVRFDPAQRIALYLAAAQWYEELVVTFPEDPRSAEFYFLLGETYTEAGENGRAVAAYQRVVHDYPEYPRAVEAGYAAILGLTQLVGSSSADELELWQRLKIDAQIEFALLFPGDPRAPAVQTDAADTLFTLGHADEAIDLAENLLAEWPNVEPALRKTALLIIGHGRFERDEFVAAETAYHALLALELNAEEAARVNERLLAAVYKQGESAEAAGEVDVAVSHYLRIAALDATAALAAQGHYDAVAVLEGATRLDEAAALLVQFRNTWPRHELAADIDMRLATLYENAQDWPRAALEYVALANDAPDRDVRRQSLYRAAEIYLDMDDVPLAIEYFRDYAHTYKQPRALAMEAMHHMDLLYQRTGEADKRRFWLKKKIALHREMGDEASERATWLAASAQLVFATDARARFAAIRLTHPLPKSLRKKQKALTQTIKAFEKVAAYGVAEYSAASTFEIANLYDVLSDAIMQSDRPKNLSELEQEQYAILLEEQAYPFEEQAIGLHEINVQRAWRGTWDEWVQRSFASLGELMPGRFDKPERRMGYARSIH